MARLLSWPFIKFMSWEPLTGPRSVGSTSNESVSGFVQTASSVFGAWRWQFSVQPMKGKLFRAYRGMVVALNGGANAIRVPFCDPDGLSKADAGINLTQSQKINGITWSNGQSWSNGKNWHPSRPVVGVTSSADEGDTLITLNDEFWGHQLLGGEWIGFFPFHFGVYVITQVLGDGEYRVWPPLRKAIDTDSSATLNPVMAMRLESESAGTAKRGNVWADSNTLTMVEVQDPDVRDYFDDSTAEITDEPSAGKLLLGSGGYLLLHDGAGNLNLGHLS